MEGRGGAGSGGEPADRGAEEAHAIAFGAARLARPARVVLPAQEALGVGHQAEDAAARIADAGDVGGRAVGVGAAAVAQGDLAVRAELGDHVRGSQEAALAVRHRQLDLDAVGDPRAARGVAGQAHPAVGVDAAGVVGERGVLAAVAGEARQQAGLDQHLEAVADADRVAAAVDEGLQLVAEARRAVHWRRSARSPRRRRS